MKSLYRKRTEFGCDSLLSQLLGLSTIRIGDIVRIRPQLRRTGPRGRVPIAQADSRIPFARQITSVTVPIESESLQNRRSSSLPTKSYTVFRILPIRLANFIPFQLRHRRTSTAQTHAPFPRPIPQLPVCLLFHIPPFTFLSFALPAPPLNFR